MAGLIALLISGVITASGAFQPVRFFVTAMGQPSQLTLVSDRGDTHTLRPYETYFGQQTSFGNRLAVYQGSFESITLWANGQAYTGGLVNGDPVWSKQGLLAWSERIDENTHRLMLWDGETIQPVEDGESLYPWQWVGDELWWIRQKSETHWQINRWQAGQVSAIYSSEQSLSRTRFLSCGGMKLSLEDGEYFYRNGEITPLPVVEGNSAVTTADCETLAYGYSNNTGSHTLLLEAGSQTDLPFRVVQMRNSSELLGIESDPESPNNLTLVHRRGDQLHRRAWPFSTSTSSPTLLLWSGDVSFWRLLQAGRRNTLLMWNQQTDDMQTFQLFGSAQVTVDTPGGRVAWAYMLDPTVIQLMLWEDGQFQQHRVTVPDLPRGIYQTTLKWMNDDSLMISMFRNPPPFQNMQDSPQTFLYRWQNGGIEALMVIPDFSAPLTDWMVWE